MNDMRFNVSQDGGSTHDALDPKMRVVEAGGGRAGIMREGEAATLLGRRGEA